VAYIIYKGGMGRVHKMLSENLKARGNLEDLGVDEGIPL
jgi:hypothetical protein